MMIIF